MPPHDPHAALFVYGTLQFSGVLEELIGRLPPATLATLRGWRAAELTGRHYPGLVRDAGSTAYGLVLSGLTTAEWHLLDAFEGEFYRLRTVRVSVPGAVWTYVWSAPDAVLPTNWDAKDFAAAHLGAFVAHCRLWRERYDGEGPAAGATG